MAIKKEYQEKEDVGLKRLNFQLEILKIELSSIQDTTAKFVEFTQTTKNWAVGIWAGSIALLLGQQVDLSKYIIFTAVLPITFWHIDAHWRHLQRRVTYRETKIREFLNDERLLQSFQEKKIVDFTIYDPTGREYRDDPDAKKFSSLWKTFKYPEVLWFYFPMVLMSILAEILFVVYPIR